MQWTKRRKTKKLKRFAAKYSFPLFACEHARARTEFLAVVIPYRRQPKRVCHIFGENDMVKKKSWSTIFGWSTFLNARHEQSEPMESQVSQIFSLFKQKIERERS